MNLSNGGDGSDLRMKENYILGERDLVRKMSGQTRQHKLIRTKSMGTHGQNTYRKFTVVYGKFRS